MADVIDLFSLCYASRSLVGDDPAEIVDIWEASQRNNEKLDITGVLYVGDDVFFQVLEGAEKTVLNKFEKISADPRHSDVVVLSEYFCATRSLAAWNMKVISQFHDRHRQSMFNWNRLMDASAQGISRRIWSLKSV